MADLSVAYAMRCAATDRRIAARDEYRTSRGAAHVAARAVWWPMVVAEIGRLQHERAAMARVYARRAPLAVAAE